MQERRNQKNIINNKIKEKQAEQEKFKQMLTLKIEKETNQIKKDNFKALKENEEKSKQKLQEYEKFFENGIPKDDEIETLIDKCYLIEKYRIEIKNYEIPSKDSDKIEELKEKFQDNDISEDIINNKISKYNNLSEMKNKIKLTEQKIQNLDKQLEIINKKRKTGKLINISISLIFVIFVIIGIVCFYKGISEYILPSLTIGGIAFIIFILRMQISKKKDKLYLNRTKEIQELKEDKQNLENDVLDLEKSTRDFIYEYLEDFSESDVIIQLTEIKTNFIKYKDIKNNMNNIFEKQNKTIKQFNELEESLKEYFGKYFKELDKAYPIYAQELNVKKNEYLKQKQDYEEKVKAREEYEKANNIKDSESDKEEIALNNISKEELKEKINILDEEINKLNDEKNYNKNQIEIFESNLETTIDIENEIEELEQKINEMSENCDILEKTRKFLEEAKDEFSSHYLDKMQKSFIKNIELISGNKMDINLDVNLNVKINEQGSSKKIDFFSTGYKDLIYICMRLSLIDSLFEEETPFIILDDPFVNLDNKKIENAMYILQNISKQYQVIYFVCHDSRNFA